MSTDRESGNRGADRACAPTLRVVGMALLGLRAQAVHAAPQTFNTALPVAQGDFVFREQFLYLQSSRDPTPADRSVEALGGVSVLGYGVTSDFTLFGVLPYVDRRLDVTIPQGSRIDRSARGIGDLTLLARYTVYQDNFPGGNFRIAPFVGVQAPTGESTAGDRFGRIPPPIQPGVGAWNLLAGAVTTYQTLDYQIDAQASYQANTTANGFSSGNLARLDASLQYRLWPGKLKHGTPGFLYGVLETNLLYQSKDRALGVDDPNSGGTSLILDPGLQLVTKQWVLEAIVQVPVMQHLNGGALQNDYTLLAGFRVNF